ncbi:MAG: hypothetical protein KBI41_02070 [Kiritimatiellae bacterium]|nr:hypothetical protein [Kiritimatiellia bacterium]
MRTQQNVKRGVWTVAVVSLALGAQAVTVINQTTKQLLFYDDFESAPAASSSAHPDTSGDYDPVATVVPGSSWLINETGPTNIQVTAYRGNGVNDPARPPQGTNYLRVVRHWDAAPSEATLVLPAVQNTPGDKIHLEMLVWIPRHPNWGAFRFSLLGSDANSRVNVAVETNRVDTGDVQSQAMAGGHYKIDGLTYRVETWQKWEVDYVIGATTFTISVDGNKKTVSTRLDGGDVASIRFRNEWAGTNLRFYLDATGYDGKSQKSLTLFRDGFERCIVGSVPALTDPEVGCYDTAAGVVVRTGATSGGPTAAYSGANYCEFTGSHSLNCMFLGGAFPPNVQKLRTRFRIWYPYDGVSAHGITKSDALSSANCLVFNKLTGYGYESHDGTKCQWISPGTYSVPKNRWVPIEMVWYPTRQTVWVTLDNGAPIQAHLYGAVPDVLDRFLFKTQTGENNNRFGVDDIEAEWVYNPGTLIVFP